MQLNTSLEKVIQTLSSEKERLIKDLIVAKVSDHELANTLTQQIQRIEVFFEEISQAKTEGELKEAIKKFSLPKE